jgi:hypothetical protein
MTISLSIRSFGFAWDEGPFLMGNHEGGEQAKTRNAETRMRKTEETGLGLFK